MENPKLFVKVQFISFLEKSCDNFLLVGLVPKCSFFFVTKQVTYGLADQEHRFHSYIYAGRKSTTL